MRNIQQFSTASALLAIIAITSTGCASIISGQNQSITLLSSKPRPYTVSYEIAKGGARVTVKSGNAPDVITLRRTIIKTYFVTWDGGEQQISGKFNDINAWYFGNFLFGGVIGMVIDMGTGSAGAFDSEIVMDADAKPATVARKPPPKWGDPKR